MTGTLLQYFLVGRKSATLVQIQSSIKTVYVRYVVHAGVYRLEEHTHKVIVLRFSESSFSLSLSLHFCPNVCLQLQRCPVLMMNQHTNAFWQFGSVPSTPVRSLNLKFFQRMWQKISLCTVVPVGGALANDCKPTALFVVHTRLEREAQVGLFSVLPQAGLKWWCVEGKASTVAIMEDRQHTVAKINK